MKNAKSNKSWFLGLVVVFCWILIISLAKDLKKVNNGFKRIDESIKKLNDEELKNIALKKKMVYVQSDFYKEKVVREKLNMQLPGETIVVMPKQAVLKTGSVGTDTEKEDIRENWEKWWQIIRN